MRTHQDSLNEQVEGLRRENKVLGQEVRDLQVIPRYTHPIKLVRFQEQLNEGARNIHELQKAQRRLVFLVYLHALLSFNSRKLRRMNSSMLRWAFIHLTSMSIF